MKNNYKLSSCINLLNDFFQFNKKDFIENKIKNNEHHIYVSKTKFEKINFPIKPPEDPCGKGWPAI